MPFDGPDTITDFIRAGKIKCAFLAFGAHIIDNPVLPFGADLSFFNTNARTCVQLQIQKSEPIITLCSDAFID